MLFDHWVEIQCSPSAVTAFRLPNRGEDYAAHYVALVNLLVGARLELSGSLWHFKYTGGPACWTDFVRVHGSLASCDRLLRTLNAHQTQLGVFVPRSW